MSSADAPIASENHIRELAELASKAQADAFDIVKSASARSVDEVKELLQRK